MAKQSNYYEQTYKAPWKGIHSQLPETEIPAENAVVARNVFLRKGELRSRPRFKQVLPPLPNGDVATCNISFVDGNNVVHTCAMTNKGMLQLNANWRSNKKQAWNLIGLYPNKYIPSLGIPIQAQVFLNRLYFVDASPNLWSWDGMSSPTIANPNVLQSIAVIKQSAPQLTAGAYFLGELDSRLLMFNTVEQLSATSFTNFQQRIRWCASGLPNQWDPSVNLGAGFNDELDVPDAITGFMAIGRTGFVFRVNGITEMFPITKGLLPFDFNHMWASERGIGNVYAYSISSFGPIGVFISVDDIYNLSMNSFEKISGDCKDAIFNDLAAATSSPIATLMPNYSQAITYISYLLCIPVGRDTRLWMYSFDDKSWVDWTFKDTIFTSKFRTVATT